jgi:hypothetical protein
MTPTIRIARGVMLPDNDKWQFRFNIESATSNRLYTIAQHKEKKHWGCDCPAWKRYRRCHHLQAMGLPPNEKSYEVNIINY